MRIEPRSDGVFLIDDRTGEEKALEEPRVSGWTASGGTQSVTPERLPETPEEIDDKIYIHPPIDREEFEASGRADLASRMLDEFGHLYPISHVNAPLWSCYGLWGFEGMMTLIATRPDLVEHACERLLHKVVARMSEGVAVGAACIWIEDCFTDMVSPEAFEALNVRFLRQLVDEIHAWGMKSIYYYCGNPAGKWDSILSIGADALSLEEGKKGFEIDIADVARRVNGRCAVLGNLDAVGILQNGTEEELRAEISRQIEAGRLNGGRFVMSLGSPVTPDTPIERVRLYCDLAREFGTGE
jgi:uroporphyrinogen-III decarboxylase